MQDSLDGGSGASLPSDELVALHSLLHVTNVHVMHDTQQLALMLSKDVKATRIQTLYRGHLGRCRLVQLKLLCNWLHVLSCRMRWSDGFSFSSSSLNCVSFVNCLLSLLYQCVNSRKSQSAIVSSYAMFCNYLLPSIGSTSRCIWAGISAAHSAADFVLLCKLFLPSRIYYSLTHFHFICVKLQSTLRGHLIRKKFNLGPSSSSSNSKRSPHATQQLASQAIAEAAQDVNDHVSNAPPIAFSSQRLFKANLSPLALQLLDICTESYFNTSAAAAVAGVLPLHPAGLLRFPITASGLGSQIGIERQKALIELRRLTNRMSRFLRGCVQRQTTVAIAVAMSLSRRFVVSRSKSHLNSLELYPIQFPFGISRIVISSFSSGFKLHSSVRAMLSSMRSNLAAVSLLLKRNATRLSQSNNSNQYDPKILAICASGPPQSRLPSRGATTFMQLRFCQEMPQGCSRLHLAPLAYNPGITRNQQVAALCYGQPLQGSWRSDQTHSQWLQQHWTGLAVAGTLHAMQDSQLLEFLLTVDHVLIGGEANARTATNNTIAAAFAAEGKIFKSSSGHQSNQPFLRDAATEFLTVCARVSARRAAIHSSPPSHHISSGSNQVIYVQRMLLLFHDLGNNFLLQLTPRQRELLVTCAFLNAFHILVAILHLQRCTRGHAARKVAKIACCKLTNQQHERHQHDSSIKISRAFKSFRARTILNCSFSMRLQRIWRGHKCRKGLVSAQAAFKISIQDSAARLLQRNWKGRLAQQSISAIFKIVMCRSLLLGHEKLIALAECIRNPSRIWYGTQSQHEADFITRSSPCVWYPVLLRNQRKWITAGLTKQRSILFKAESDTYSVFIANASIEAVSDRTTILARAWKCHCCKKMLKIMLRASHAARMIVLFNFASCKIQRAWRIRCARTSFCSRLEAYIIVKQQRSSAIIVRGTLCFKSRRQIRFLRERAAACTLQRSFRMHTAAADMINAAKMAGQEYLIVRREVAAARLQSVYRGRAVRLKCLNGAASLVFNMLSWNSIHPLPYDGRQRLAVVISRHRPYVHAVGNVDARGSSGPVSAPSNNSFSLMRRVATICCSCATNVITRWGLMQMQKEQRRCLKLAQLFVRRTLAAILLQAAYRAHFHRRKHVHPLLPKYRSIVLQRRRITAATSIQCLWRCAVARLALACLSAFHMRGRWMTRTQWAHTRAQDAISMQIPPNVQSLNDTHASITHESTYFDAKLNGWCIMSHPAMISVLSPIDTDTINVATIAAFELCGRIEGFSGSYPSSDRFFGGDSHIATWLQQIECSCPQHTTRCWDSVCSCVPKDPTIFAADPSLNPAQAILSYLRQFVSAMLAQRKSARERDSVLLNLRLSRHGAGARTSFSFHLPDVATGSLRLMLIHSSAAVLGSVHWLFTRWGNTELMGGHNANTSFMFPISHDSEFVRECHGVWSMLLHCHVRPLLFCLDMLISSLDKPLFGLLHGAVAALVCDAISALLMLMSYWLQTTLHPQHAHQESALWILFGACSLESKYISSYLDDSLLKNSPSICLNVVMLLHAFAVEHEACVSASLGRQSESVVSLTHVESILRQLSINCIRCRRESDHLHGSPSPAEQKCWRDICTSSALLFDCFSSSAECS